MKTLLLSEDWKLKDDYKTIVVSATQLQNHLSPFMHSIEDVEEQEEVFSYGDLVEQIRSATISGTTRQEAEERWRFKAEQIRDYLLAWAWHWKRDVKKKEYLWLTDNCHKIVDYCLEYELRVPQRDMFNFRSKIAIECRSYKVILSWEYDAWVTWSMMADCKSAWKLWDEEKISTRRQNIYYPLISMVHNDEPDDAVMSFSFQIFSKHKKMQFQQINSLITFERAKEILKEDLTIYLTDLNTKKPISVM